MVNGDAGKGDAPRPVDRKKWDAAWRNWKRKKERRRKK